MRLKRWFYTRFRTRVTPTLVNRFAGRIPTVDEWETAGGWNSMVPGVRVERPDWWRWGCTSSVDALTEEAARAALDEWQARAAAETTKRPAFSGRALHGHRKIRL